MVIEINLTKGKTAIIDDEDKDLMKYGWQAYSAESHLWYAQRSIRYRGLDGKLKNQVPKMHRIILERILGRPLDKSEQTDHINRNGLDNRRSNLRVATPLQNSLNKCKKPWKNDLKPTSNFKGVSWYSWRARGKYYETGKWLAGFYNNGKRVHLGYFASEVEAARAYDRAALEHFGEFARTNFDKEDYK